MSFKFTMLAGEVEIDCEISNAALMDLAVDARFATKESQFFKRRDEIERAAGFIFVRNSKVKAVRIFAKDFKPKYRGERE